ncbi:MAG: protein-glutamate O-methyltransferase CheR [Gemmatimonadota bacterium]|nr:protein-glutamate O-methyltransferase CheR [Gemmatimonadota bacterium]
MEMDSTLFDRFRTLVYDQSGITLGAEKQALVCARVGKRMRSLGLADHRQYYETVLEDKSGRELVALLDVISTNVTHFFREEKHFQVLGELLARWRKEGQSRIRIWCSASSTGEEPYSIAMTVCETYGDNAGDTKILATDISTGVLQEARQGIYKSEKVEKVPSHLATKYFERHGGRDSGLFRVRENLRRLVTFGRLNLSVHPYPLNGPLDIIFCRNVMIYFDSVVREKVLASMYKLLKPGGYLMVGHAESLTGLVSDFKTVMPAVYIKE